MNEAIRYSLVKPTLDTPFHIDFEWWRQNDNNWRVYLHDCLCAEHQAVFQSYEEDSSIDSIDPTTAEVKRVDGLQHTLMTHCARQPGFLTSNTTLVDAVFRAFLGNGNQPMSPRALAAQINRPAETILRTIAGPHIYKGLRPFKN